MLSYDLIFSPQSKHCWRWRWKQPWSEPPPFLPIFDSCTCLIIIFPLWTKMSRLLPHMHLGEFPESEGDAPFLFTRLTNSRWTCALTSVRAWFKPGWGKGSCCHVNTTPILSPHVFVLVHTQSSTCTPTSPHTNRLCGTGSCEHQLLMFYCCNCLCALEECNFHGVSIFIYLFFLIKLVIREE